MQFISDYNHQSWPLQICALIVAIWILWLLHQPQRHKTINYLFAGCWLWVGWFFHLNYYQLITPFAKLYAGAFIVEGALFIILAEHITYFNPFTHGLSKAGYWMLAAVFLLPILAASITGQNLWQIPMVGLMPTPTALATIALLSLTCFGKRWLLVVIPLIWCILFSLMTCQLNLSNWYLPLLLAAGMATLLLVEHKKQQQT
nr:DUF6064 family protein [Neptunicella marina]